jgi:hypothetical protein
MANRRFIDFPIAASVGNNDIVLIWQDGLNKQTTKATLLQGSPQSLAGLTDVDIAALTNGQILQYNSTTSKWENVDRTDIFLSQLGDVTIVAPSNGQVLVYNSSTSKWENSSGGYVPYTGAVTTVNLGAQSILAGSFVKAGGTAAQFLKANGSVDSTAYGTGSVTSVALTMPTAFTVAGSPITTAGTLAVTGAGLVSQYIRGDGSLADFPATTGGGSSVSYYLNGSVSQGTIGGVAYRELNRTPIFGAGTDITINADGYIASFITDALDPNKLLIPAGNWNFETYFSANSGGGSPTFYVELYKYNGTTFTLIATSSGTPELIAFGTNINPYFSTLAVPETVLALTDRLAVRFYVTHSGRTITLHTENGHLCQVITTFTTGLTALNGLTSQVQFFAVGTSGTDFAISSASDTHTFNLPTASGTNRGALSSGDWSTFNNKENAITAGTTAQYFRGDKTFQTLNTSVVPELTNLYYTEARVNANANVAANTAARHNAVTLGTANGLSLSTQVLSLGLASAGVTGALSGTDWSTFNNKQNALTNPVTGTGTTNYLAKFTGSTTVGNSQVFDNGTQVGIGTASPDSKLTVNGQVRVSDLTLQGFYQARTSDTAGGGVFGGNSFVLRNGATSEDLNFDVFNRSTFVWYTPVTIKNTGNVLIGTTTDNGAKLQVNGAGNTAINISGNGYSIFQSSAHTYTPNAIGLSIGYNRSGANGETTLVWGAPASGFNFEIASILSGTITPRLTITNTGNLLVGTTTDAGFKLDVSGTGRFSGNGFFGNATALAGLAGGISVNGSTNSGINFRIADVLRGYVYVAGSGAMVLESTSGNILLSPNGNPSLTIAASTGAATFSSSVTANGAKPQLYVKGDSGNGAGIHLTTDLSGSNRRNWGIFTEENIEGDFAIKSSSAAGGNPNSGTTRFLITSGGNMLIGTLTDNGARLQVSGTATFSSDVTTSGSGFQGRYHRIFEASGQRGGFYPYNVISGGGADYSIGLFSESELFFLSGGGVTKRMVIANSGNVLIGTTTDAGHKLLVNGTARFDNPNGITLASSTQFRQIYFDGFSNLYFWNGSNQSLLTSAGVWQNASDVSIKKEITDIKYGLSDLMLLNPRSYKMKTDGLEQIGFIAQEVEKIIPEVVNSDNKGMKGLSYGNIVALLVKAIQELKAELDELKSKN